MLFSTAQEVREGRVADEEVDLKKHKENIKKKEQSHAYTGNQVIIIHYRKRASTRTHRTA